MNLRFTRQPDSYPRVLEGWSTPLRRIREMMARWKSHLSYRVVMSVVLMTVGVFVGGCAASSQNQRSIPEFPEYREGRELIERQNRLREFVALEREYRERKMREAYLKAMQIRTAAWHKIGPRPPSDWKPRSGRWNRQ